MKGRTVLAYVLVVVLLAAGSVQAGGPQPAGPTDAAGVDASPGAWAPWLISTVDSGPSVGSHASIAIDVDGATFISYYDSDNKDLKMARYVGTEGNCGENSDWWCSTVDDAQDVGRYSSIAMNPVGLWGIAYYDAAYGELQYAEYVCPLLCYWSKQTVDVPLITSENKGQHASLKYASDGTPYIAYYFEKISGVDSLMIATYVGSSGNCGDGSSAGKWQCDILDTGDRVGQYASLDLDSSDEPRIAYYDEGGNSLMYAFRTGGYWTVREILPTNAGQYASLDVDADNGNLPHIAHYDSTNGKLGYAVWVGVNGNCGFNSSNTRFEWQCDEIATMGTPGTHPRTRDVSLAVDGGGYPIIAYSWFYGDPYSARGFSRARPSAALGHRYGNCGSDEDWECETIDSGYSTGDYSSVAVNPDGLATVAYYYNYYGYSNLGLLKVSYQHLYHSYLPLIMSNH